MYFLNEGFIINQKDIFYNKEKFDSNKINICFITGHPGSGKTSMAKKLSLENKNIEYCELDKVITNWDLSEKDLKENGDLIYSFFNGVGKEFRYTNKKDWDNDKKWDNRNEFIDGYEALLTKKFIKYSILYAKKHKEKKFIIEGIWIFLFCEPNEFDDYAFFIKGTSLLISKIRAAKRDSVECENYNRIGAFLSILNKEWKNYFLNEKKVLKFYNYFYKKI